MLDKLAAKGNANFKQHANFKDVTSFNLYKILGMFDNYLIDFTKYKLID
jgi:hypothetical protein